jgi:hypothetical protein
MICLGSGSNLQTPHPLSLEVPRGLDLTRPEIAAVGLLRARAGRVGGMSVTTGNPASGLRLRLALERDMISFQPIAQSPLLPIRRQTAQHAMSVRP